MRTAHTDPSTDVVSRWSNLIDLSEGYGLILDASGTIRFLHPRWEDFLGKEAKSWVGRPFAALIDPAARASLSRALKIALAKPGSPQRFTASLDALPELSLRCRCAAQEGETEDGPKLLLLAHLEDNSARPWLGVVRASQSPAFLVDRESMAIIEANHAAERLLRRSVESLLGTRFPFLLSDETRPALQKTWQSLRQVGSSREVGGCLISHMGHAIEVSLTLQSVGMGERNGLTLVHANPILVGNEAEVEEAQRLLTVAATLNVDLVGATEANMAVKRGLATIGDALSVDRAYIFQNLPATANRPEAMSIRWEWCAEGVEPCFDDPAIKCLPYSGGFAQWLGHFRRRACVFGHTRDFERDIREVLTSQEVRSLLLVPIFVKEQLWGFLGVEQCSREREWTALERSALALMGTGFAALCTRVDYERQLRDSIERRRHASRAGKMGTWLWDLDNQTIQADAGLFEAFGLEENEIGVAYEEWAKRIVPEDLGRLEEATHSVLVGETPYLEAVCRIRHKEGGIRWLKIRGEPAQDPHGDGRVMIGASVDISELKWVEQALIESKERAETAARAKSQFLAMMSHEIRTPLNAVVGFAELLECTPLREEQATYVRNIVDGSENLLAIINDILDFSKLNSGQTIEIEQVPMSPQEQVERVINMLGNKATEKGLGLEVSFSPSVPRSVKGDPGRFRQVVTNLVHNAIKFTDEGTVTVSAEAHLHGVEDTWEIAIAVSDTGCGIPPEKQQAVFEPFVQADSSSTRRFGGTGLGLAICRRLIEKMGGNIRYFPRPEGGSTFEFTIRCLDASETDGRAALAEHPPLVALGDRQLVVFYAEDNFSNQIYVRSLLHELRHRIETFESAELLFEALRRERPDIVLMDLQMPGISGIEAARRIRRGDFGEDAANVPIIAFTASAMESDRRECLEAGMNDFLAKPVRAAQLRAALDRAVAVPAPTPERSA